jgi:hypothetical protein
MAWMAAHIFIESSEMSAAQQDLRAPLSELLADPARRADPEGLIEPPGPVQISAPLDGWIAVTGVRAWLADLPAAAEHLSRALGAAAVVSFELVGNCYRLRIGQFASGERKALLQTPEGDWSCEEEPAVMPLYEDCEQQAYDTLTKLGIPPALVAMGTAPFNATSGEPATMEAPALTLTPGPAGGEAEVGEQPLSLPLLEGDDAPVLPNGLSQDFGIALFEERYIEGAAEDETLARLLAIEQAMLERAQRSALAHGGKDEEERVSLTVTYLGGKYQARLDRLLQAEGHHTPPATMRERPPWWAFWRYLGKVR